MNVSGTSSTTVSKPVAQVKSPPPPPRQAPPPPPPPVDAPERGSRVNIKT